MIMCNDSVNVQVLTLDNLKVLSKVSDYI